MKKAIVITFALAILFVCLPQSSARAVSAYAECNSITVIADLNSTVLSTYAMVNEGSTESSGTASRVNGAITTGNGIKKAMYVAKGLKASTKYYIKIYTYGGEPGLESTSVLKAFTTTTDPHTPSSDWIPDPNNAAQHIKVCSVCKETLENGAHDSLTTIPAVPATCTQAGATEGKKCSMCGQVTVAPVATKLLDHVYAKRQASTKIATVATCEKPAMYFVMCDVCGTVSETETVPVGAALGHYYLSQLPSDKQATEATCTQPATYYVLCERCRIKVSDSLTVPVGAPLGHDYVETAVVAPTCTSAGYTAYECLHCGDKYKDRTPARGHWYGEWSPAGDETHVAACKRSGCSHTSTVNCEFIAAVLNEGSEMEQCVQVCPVCGDAGDARLALVIGAQVKAYKGSLPRGELTVRTGELKTGETLLSACFEFAGQVSQFSGKIKLYLPAAEFEGYSFELISTASEQIPAAIKEIDSSRFVVLDIDFSSNAVLLRLVPAA